MKIICPGCHWSADVPDEKIPPAGVTATCRKCQTRFTVSRPPPPVAEPAFSCPNCGTVQAVSDTCVQCHIVFAKYAEKQRQKEAAPPPEIQMSVTEPASRFKGIAYAVIALLVAALLFYRVEIVSAGKLYLNIQPAHAKHIPATAITVTRCNVAAIFLKTGLKGATSDPVYRKLLEYGGKLYPRFDELLANPVKESGIELAEDVYAFTELQEGHRSRLGVLFGINDRDRFAEFLQRLKPGTPTSEAGVSILRLDGNTTLYWNRSFALIYPEYSKNGGKQRALAIMSMKKEESIAGDPLKKKWLAGKDDCLVSVDLEKLVSQPSFSILMKSSLYGPEVYKGSTLAFALNFTNGKAMFDARVNGAPLLNEIRTINAPPSKEFLESIPVDNFLFFLVSHIPFAPLQERFRQTNPEQYRHVDEMVTKLTTATMEQLATSFTGDIGMVLESVPRRSSGFSAERYAPGYQPTFLPDEARADGSIVLGVKPDSAAVQLLHRMLQDGPEARIARRDGPVYLIGTGGNGYYLLADNRYIALSTHREVVSGLAERKKGDKPAMPAHLLERASGAISMMELKLGPLFEALGSSRQGDATFEQLKNSLAELRISSRLEKDQVSSRGELLFRDENRNSLYQLAKLGVAIGDARRSGSAVTQ